MMYHLAQVNVARMLAPLDDPLMAEFVAQLDTINALADGSVGFVWRFQSAEGNATSLRPYADDRILVNFSVWESLEAFIAFTYASAHRTVMQRRREWFSRFDGAYMALWWVPAGHVPDVVEAKDRLDYLRAHGPTARAFTVKQAFPPPGEHLPRLDLGIEATCGVS
jgi:heme-degrading monooxygenase HmoA